LGANVIINTGARVDHDCAIDAHAHIAPGVTLCGNVHIGYGAHIGSAATIIQGVKVGPRAIVGAGAVVIGDVPEGVTVVGIPAIPLTKQHGARSK
jgi:acetyltransferase-like isoleucine patch superfamily enzyme